MIDNNTEKNELTTNSTIENPLDINQLKLLEKLPRQTFNTAGSQGFANRLATSIRRFYESYNLLSEPQIILIVGALLGSSLTLQNIKQDYRIDKSPTSTIDTNISDWYQLDAEIFVEYTDIIDQPKYSYNKTYLLAKSIGFPTKFEL